MTSENNQELSELAIFSDGFGIKPQNPMSPEYADEAKGYLQYKTPNNVLGPQDVVVHAASSTITELKNAFNWVTDELRDTDLTLDFKLDDTPFFFAQCQPTSDRPDRALTIYVGLGCVPVFVGITNRILHMQNSGPITLEAEMQGRLPMHIDKWHPELNPIGTLIYDYVNERNTSTSTVDSVLLIFFHEIAHALRGHAWIKPGNDVSDAAHRRALESDADWCAGYLFMKYELRKLNEENRLLQKNLTEVCERLAVASSSLNCALQVKSNNASELYHLPYMRNRDNFFGAELAWREMKLPYDFVNLINDAYGQLVLLDNILAHRLEQWVAQDDPRNIVDEVEKKTLTEPIVRSFHNEALQLERGPIKGARALWASIMYPKPDFKPKSFYLQS